MNSKFTARGIAKSLLLSFAIIAIAGAAGFALRNATVSKLYGLELEQTKVATTNKIGLFRRTVAFESDPSRFGRTRVAYRFASKNFPWLYFRTYQHFPSLSWRLGVGSKSLQLDAHEMQWSSGGSSGGYLYAIGSGVANSKWEFIHWTGMNIDDLTPDIVRQSFGNGPKESESLTIAAGQIVFARLGTNPGTIYVLKVQASSLNRAIVDYASIPSQPTWPLASSADRDSAATCIANLRRIGTYAALYAQGNGGILPSNFAQLRSASPAPLQIDCPGKLPDGTIIDFGSLEHESSYIIIVPGMDSRKTENTGKVYAGCLKHGFVCLNDGSANNCREPVNDFMNQYSILLGGSKFTNPPAK